MIQFCICTLYNPKIRIILALIANLHQLNAVIIIIINLTECLCEFITQGNIIILPQYYV